MNTILINYLSGGRKGFAQFGYVLLVLPGLCHAELDFLADWSMYGSNTVRASLYDATGPGAASPYPSEGDMFFDEFNVYLNKKNSRYDTMRAEVTGVYNLNDDYRAPDFGVVPERMSFVRENGEANTPYRAEAGDHFAYYSYLTLQQSLKGFQLELQPVTDHAGRRHSLVFTTGANESNWRDLTLQDDYTTGLSWLIQDELLGSLNLNMVHNYRDGSAKAGTLDRKQYVFSMAGEKQFSGPGHDAVIEAEIAHFKGDHNGLAGAVTGQDRADNGYFMQLRGQSKQSSWNYRLRLDYYGQDFRPRGAIVTADRRSAEFHSGWLHHTGIRTRARAQFFEDGFETANKTSTRTYGVNFTGPLLIQLYPDANGSMDAFIQQRTDEAGVVDVTTKNINFSLTKPLGGGWLGRSNFFFQNVDDEGTADADIFTRQFSFGADHSIELAGFKGVITPGILLRSLRKGGNHSFDMSPTLAVSLNRGPHFLRADYSTLLQNREIAISGPDIDTHALNLDYRYSKRQHIFGFEANLFDRSTNPGDSTEAYRLSVYWTWNFDRPPVAVAARTHVPVAPVDVAEAEIQATMYGLAPGVTEDKVQAALTRAGISGGVEQAGYVTYEAPLLDEVFRRQRLVLEYIGNVLHRSALVIDFDSVGDRDTIIQTFERVRQVLIRQLGNPARTIEEGEFTANFVADVNSQRLIRIIEWRTPTGTIRFGIPRRLDSQVRMEIQHARRFPQPGETLWSVEEIR